jgi:hypothetical protein
VPRPERVRDIAPHECPECDELANNLLPHPYGGVPDEIMEWHQHDLALLSAAALHYYLPSWLLYSLRHPQSDALESTIFHLTPSEIRIAEDRAYWQDRLAVFSGTQRSAIASFFREVERNDWWTGFDNEFERAAALWGAHNRDATAVAPDD